MSAKRHGKADLEIPRVVHCMSGERYDVYAGRGRCPQTNEPGEWGNLYSHRPSKVPGIIVVATVEEAVALHRRALWKGIQGGAISLEKLAALHGKVWGCWCHQPPCHAYTLAAAAAWAFRVLES